MSHTKVAQQIIEAQLPTVEEITVLIYRRGETVRYSGRCIVAVPRPLPMRAGRASLEWTSCEGVARQVQALLNSKLQTPTVEQIADVLESTVGAERSGVT